MRQRLWRAASAPAARSRSLPAVRCLRLPEPAHRPHYPGRVRPEYTKRPETSICCSPVVSAWQPTRHASDWASAGKLKACRRRTHDSCRNQTHYDVYMGGNGSCPDSASDLPPRLPGSGSGLTGIRLLQTRTKTAGSRTTLAGVRLSQASERPHAAADPTGIRWIQL